MVKGLVFKSSEDQLQELELFSLEKRKLERDMISIFRGYYMEEELDEFHMTLKGETRSNV